MKNIFKGLLGVLVLAAIIVPLGILGCDDDNDDSRDNMLLGLLLMSNSDPAALSPEQAVGANAASAVSSAASSAVSGITVSSNFINPVKFLAELINNGNDPEFIKRSIEKDISRFVKKKRNAELAAISSSGSGNSRDLSGYTNGLIKGAETTVDYGATYPELGTCNVTYSPNSAAPDSTTENVLTLSGSTVAILGTGTGNDFTGTMTTEGTFTFTDFAASTLDPFTMFQTMSTVDQTAALTCQRVQDSMDIMHPTLTVMSGAVTVQGVGTFSATFPKAGTIVDGLTTTYASNTSTTLNSTNLTVDGSAVTLENVVLTSVLNYSMTTSGSSITTTGTATVTLSGTVNGADVSKAMTFSW